MAFAYLQIVVTVSRLFKNEKLSRFFLFAIFLERVVCGRSLEEPFDFLDADIIIDVEFFDRVGNKAGQRLRLATVWITKGWTVPILAPASATAMAQDKIPRDAKELLSMGS